MSLTPKQRAEKSARAMWGGDRASAGMGMSIVDVDEGSATLTKTVLGEDVNGHGICHGGVIFSLADSAFAFACNSRNQATVAQHNTISFIAPAQAGDRLTAIAREVSLTGRNGLYDVAVTNQDGVMIAQMRGASRAVGGGAKFRRRGRCMKDLTPARSDLDPIEIASRDEIEALQLERLKWSLAHAYGNVPFYRNRFDAAGVHPDDVTSLADLEKFPFTHKQDLRDAYPFGMFAVPRDRLFRIHASSGTTGQPTVVGYTRADVDMWGDMVARSLRAAGVRPGDMVHNAYGYGLFTGGLGAHQGIEKLGACVVPVSGGMTERQVTLINDFKPQAITVTPSYMLNILEQFNAAGLDPRATSLNVGIFGAEPWTNAMRREVEESFDMHAVDIYGLSEILGPGVANECVETKDGLHIWEDHFYPEIIDPNTGDLLPDGEIGELVLTTLTKQALPMIRYRTRDLTRLMAGTARSMRRMEKITGRSDDMIILRGVNVFPTQIEEQLMRFDALAPYFQIELVKAGRMDAMRVHVEPKPGSDGAEAGRLLADRVKSVVGVSAEVIVGAPGSVERSQGKARRVIDNRGT